MRERAGAAGLGLAASTAGTPPVAAFLAQSLDSHSAAGREDAAVDHMLPLFDAFGLARQRAVRQDVQLHVSLAQETFVGRRGDEEARGLKSCRLDHRHDFERPPPPERHLGVQLDVLALVDPRVDGSDATRRRGRGYVGRLADADAEVLSGPEEENGLLRQNRVRDGVGLSARSEVEGVGRAASSAEDLHANEGPLCVRRAFG